MYDLNRSAIRLRIDKNIDQVVAEAAAVVKQEFGLNRHFDPESIDSQFLHRLLVHHFRHRLKTLRDLVADEYRFIWIKPDVSKNASSELHLLDGAYEMILTASQNEEGVEQLPSILSAYSKQKQVKFSSLMRQIRILLTGLPTGLPVGDILKILGPHRIRERVEDYFSQKATATSTKAVD